ncbi:MAG: 16S rRNA (adenine(1518)-N(6)/adenine(1519)-N(6))-dimethyltransferase RsmA [Rhodocyclaceae bacterium]|nr:16S rRNA (adenine(1518)-N(6)/adenine(1519)-N(6))-dimethyltransferase RsmA [Rhodocyclaceae bacterium]
MKHIPRRRFGQNFLVATGVIRDIVATIAPRRDDRVVEIGPGLGALTEPLCAAVDCLHVVEIDRDLIARLRGNFPPQKLVVHEGDALEFDFGSLGSDLRIIGNLPYNISTPLLFHLATYAGQVRDMHFMLQKEVVDRMVAEPGTADYGRLSVMLQYRFDMERLFDVPPEAFDPAPKVDSAIVRLVPRPAAALTARDDAVFARVVMAAFSQRRKMLRNTLRDLFTAEALVDLGIRPTARAEELPVAVYVALANSLAP